MINIFTLHQGRLHQEEFEALNELDQKLVLWVDIEGTEKESFEAVAWHFGVQIPADILDDDLEESARYFESEEGALCLRSTMVYELDGKPADARIAFVYHKNVLFSIHSVDSPVLRLLRLRARRQLGLVSDAKDVLLSLYSTDAEYAADILENIYDELELISAKVLQKNVSSEDLAASLAQIAREEDMNGRIRRNLMDTRRSVSFIMRYRILTADQFEDARQILRDLDSLDGHTKFLFDKINFLMDAIVGFINLNQSHIIKLFSVASVAFLPPLLVASIYGMNFTDMPELKWSWGYPFAMVLMVASTTVTLLYFYKRGWLK